MRIVGSTRASTHEQASGLRVQEETIEAAATARGWEIVGMYADRGASGRSMDGRPGLAAALDAVESGAADALVVARLDRPSRSLLDFAGLMERSRRNGWALVALDLGVDTTTPAGEMMAAVIASFAQYERRLIGQRTKDARRRTEGPAVEFVDDRPLDQILIADEPTAVARPGAIPLGADGIPGDRCLATVVKSTGHSEHCCLLVLGL